MRNLKDLSQEKKQQVAKELNEMKNLLVSVLDARDVELQNKEIEKKLQREAIDITLPSREIKRGKIHLISHVLNEIVEIFGNMGFGVEYGAHVEDDFHNFDALNIDENHPARQNHDTFYMKHPSEGASLLRTHTSTVQIRTMSKSKPPFKFISPGRVYRCDSDQTHTPMFHQVEGVLIDDGIDMGHLKGCLKEFLHAFFGDKKIEIRFRPHFFPFTEPSAEVDISMDGGNKWLEILGCGMVHPNVLKNVGLDSNAHQGFAFGMGVERLAMLKYDIEDLRTFFDGDKRCSAKHGVDFHRIPKLIWGLNK
jgi:phenylalanyl-tRNA synthetase alpha chain